MLAHHQERQQVSLQRRHRIEDKHADLGRVGLEKARLIEDTRGRFLQLLLAATVGQTVVSTGWPDSDEPLY